MSRFRVPVLCAAWLLAARLPGQDLTVVSKTTAPGLSAPARYYDGRRLAAVALGPMGALFQRMYEELKKVTGFPLSTAVIFRTPVFRTETLEEATEVRKGSIPPSTFEVPAGYKKVRSPLER
ncbi:MAG TPA: hypothetical protein VOA00_08100 [Thermoanaerobaculia bacterium]|nr:hypothetical protein [Thermoanaerobaculia bacterium]